MFDNVCIKYIAELTSRFVYSIFFITLAEATFIYVCVPTHTFICANCTYLNLTPKGLKYFGPFYGVSFSKGHSMS